MSTSILTRKRTSPLQGITTEVIHVDALIAAKLLDGNIRNRRMKSRKVAQMARDMVRGAWDFNGESVQIDENGLILNGQHRLSAVIEANGSRPGISVPLLIVKGLAPEVQDTIDIGTKRSLADALTMHGEKNAHALAAVARRAILWSAGNRTGNAGEFMPSDPELRDFIATHPLLGVAAAVGHATAGKIPVPPSVIALAYYLCVQKDPEHADHFYRTQLTEGVGLNVGDPALALRNLALRPIDQDRRLTGTAVLGYTLRAWNAYRSGERLTKLQAPRSGGWNATNIPTPL